MAHVPYEPAADDTFLTVPNSYLDQAYISCNFGCFNSSKYFNSLRLCAHPNGIAFLALGNSPLINSPTTCAAVNPTQRLSFDIGGYNLLNSPFRKGRGPALAVGQPLCALVDESDECTIQCPVKSVLVEINPRAIVAEGQGLLRYVIWRKCSFFFLSLF